MQALWFKNCLLLFPNGCKGSKDLGCETFAGETGILFAEVPATSGCMRLLSNDYLPSEVLVLKPLAFHFVQLLKSFGLKLFVVSVNLHVSR